MIIGVMGDSHSRCEYIDMAMEHLKNVDLIIHTGDNNSDLHYITNRYGIEAIGVKGNCDTNGDVELIKEIQGKRFFICHGHQYNIKSNLNTIFYKGKEVNADIVIFGHSHIPCYVKEEEMILLNPGSVSEPRGGSQRSIVVMELEEDIKIKFLEID